MKNDLTPIPTPKAQLWKEFRVAYLPWIVMVVSVCVTWLVWSRVAVAPTMMGEVEVVRAQVVCPEVGIVRNVLVDRFAEVKTGDPLVEVQLTDRRSILDAIRIELGMLNSDQLTDTRAYLFCKRIENVNGYVKPGAAIVGGHCDAFWQEKS